jgi:hypothetical protein
MLLVIVAVMGLPALSQTPSGDRAPAQGAYLAAALQWIEGELDRIEGLEELGALEDPDGPIDAPASIASIASYGARERGERLRDFALLLRRTIHERGQGDALGARVAEVLARLREIEARAIVMRPSAAASDPGNATSGRPRHAKPAANDDCDNALPLSAGMVVVANLTAATLDGASSCAVSAVGDVWYRIVQSDSAPQVVHLPAGGHSGLLSLYSGCPATTSNQLACGNASLSGHVLVPPVPGEYWLGVSSSSAGSVRIALSAAGRIRGQVRDRQTGEPVTTGEVSSPVGAFRVALASDGTYDSGPVAPLLHAVTVESNPFGESASRSYMFQHWPEQYFPLSCFEEFAPRKGVQVPFGGVADGIDFDLLPNGAVSGRVTRASDGSPILGAEMIIQRLCGAPFPIDTSSAFTDADGRYRIDPVFLSGDPYFVLARHSDFGEQAFDGFACTARCGSERDSADTTPILVRSGETAAGIDFRLEAGGNISGRVTGEDTGEPLLARILVVGPNGLKGPDAFKETMTDSDGFYSIGGLAASTYFVSVSDERGEYLGEIYRDVPCPWQECDEGLATTVAVGVGESVEGIDFSLGRLGSISGRATSTGPDPGDLVVEVADGQGNRKFESVETSGSYRVTGLPPGDYFVRAFGTPQAAAEVWDDHPCPRESCDPALTGDPITVGLGQQIESIDLRLDHPPCFNSPHFLCLADRFRVSLNWQTSSAGSPAFVERLSKDAATFWFFDQSNVEAIVKIVNACKQPAPSFWVFAAGLTNVATVLRVQDTVAGEGRSYFGALNEPFPSVFDFQSFQTCTAPTGASRPAGALSELGRR